MASSQLTLIISIVMVTMFSIAILGYAFGFADDNSAIIDIRDDPEIYSLDSVTRGNVDTYVDETEDSYESIVKSTVEEGSDVVKSSGSFSITWGNIFTTMKNIMQVGYEKIFGSGDDFGIFLTAFFGVIGLMAALYLIKTWRGNP